MPDQHKETFDIEDLEDDQCYVYINSRNLDLLVPDPDILKPVFEALLSTNERKHLDGKFDEYNDTLLVTDYDSIQQEHEDLKHHVVELNERIRLLEEQVRALSTK